MNFSGKKNKLFSYRKFLLIISFLLIIIFFFVYKYKFYTPPLVSSGKRNFIENIMDFSFFSWHMGKTAFYRIFFRKDISGNEYPKAAWYRIEYYPKLMNMDTKDLYSIAEGYKQKRLDDFVRQLYLFFLKQNLSNSELLTRLADFFAEQEDWEHLKLTCEKILEISPKDLIAHYLLGLSFLNLNELTESENVFVQLTCLSSNFADAYYRLGLIYLKRKQYDKAINMFEKAVAILPNHLDALLKLESCIEKSKIESN